MAALSLFALAALTAQTALAKASPTQASPKAVASKVVAPRIVRVAMFANGYAFVTRRVEFQGRVATVPEFPEAALGTLVVLSDDPQGIERIETVVEPGKSRPDLTNFGAILARNVGRRVKITIGTDPRYGLSQVPGESVEGIIENVAGDLVYLKGSTARRILSLMRVAEVASPDPAFVLSRGARNYRIVKRRAGGSVTLVSLERGLTWTPSYVLQTDGETKITLIARASVLNDLADLKAVRARVVSGLPSLPYRGLQDPLSSGLNPARWINLVAPRPQSYGGQIDYFNDDPADRLSSGYPYGGYGGGGFGGGGGGGAEGPAGIDITKATVDPASAQNVAELLFYDLPNLTLARGDRQARDLFRFDGAYERLFLWRVTSGLDPDLPARTDNRGERVVEKNEVSRAFVFRNTGKLPLAPAPVALFADGEYTGGAAMPYVAPGEEVELRVGLAPDVVPESVEEQVTRVRAVESYRAIDRVTIKGTLRLTNRRGETTRVRITKDLPGEVTQSDGDPAKSRRAGPVGALNARTELVWTATLAPGESVTRTYVHTFLVYS